MPNLISPYRFIELSASLPVIDVRSPGEYVKGHIHGAFNLPLFTNEERSVIGTLYVKSGKDIAVKEGLEMVGKKFGFFISEIEKLVPDKEMLVHCWRGGMRSESLAWFFEKLGHKVSLLQGGYKSYRSFIRKEFSKPMNILLIGGMTGSGKTELLNRIAAKGQQIIDLEALANHKGSSFGHLGQKVQPTTEQFENDLFDQWNSLNIEKALWLEYESKQVGKIFMPDPFHEAMLRGVLIKIDIPRSCRIKRLVNEYACFEMELLEAVLLHLKQSMGTLQCKKAIEALQRSDFETVADISLDYYDKTYQTALEKRPVKVVHKLEFENDDMLVNADRLLTFARVHKLLP
ncbi:MAG: tRNA 2-selenouridine(34) synthase MnmH [Bacteroidetes bacterium]|nr:tRNA 2-selenouridine(34) synthase MnmH [Bacteroidota bacterium]